MIHRQYCIFPNILSCFIDNVFFADHEHVFLQILYILHFENNNTMLHFFLHIMTALIVHGKICLHHMHILHICSTWKTRDGRKCVKNFGVLGVSGLNK